MSFFTELQKNINDINNLQRTENGAIGYKSTGKTILDMNFNVPKYRNATPETIIEKFNQARSENPELAILWTFFAILIPKLQRRLFLWFLNTADGTI